MENKTTIYVEVNIIGFHSFSGSDKAKATEIPPFKPPQVIIGTTPCEKSRKGFSRITGIRTEENLAIRHKIIANMPAIISFIEKTIDNTLKPRVSVELLELEQKKIWQ